ncbi:1-pyrroline-5-carboxylate dehydrogenase [Leptospira perolatii]|uniref:L-glutamate gamma-semialdehyde dehydrogenase n=1 Tax=Leptospira perolatii TaxID=2023191 RepID=A0A2M9ZJJ9_9LEPT|nr:aldehyde dehydrogenase family protein [Leptospira perolatii]PJZ68833.1 1-pyrroline-5-carboxylate dehydrogenase [Leptospira perolatii]PJZ72164.1 1-pyrroline-5-carboxylate dehydrogenase [Leptospira perolatii]
MLREAFENEPLIDFSKEEQRILILNSVQNLRKSFPIKVKPVVSGRSYSSGQSISVPNPAKLGEIVSSIEYADRDLTEKAVQACEAFSENWKLTSAKNRIEIIMKAADLLRKNKAELIALLILEVGKGAKDADAEVAEAIDFCTFYSKEMESLSGPRTRNFPGEDNSYIYRPRGTTAVIAPWNFPLAILCGMTVAPLLAGNTVIMKPAEQSSAIAFRLYNILIDAGVPSEVLHFLPGNGEVIGAYLVTHPKIHTINFTGSRAVGLGMLQSASQTNANFIKRVVAEMGGKNAIIVDEDADLDEAVIGALVSAFGFQGQKCSALSRLIVLEQCYKTFIERFSEGLKSWKIGMPEDPSVKIGPVIDRDARTRLEQVIEKNKSKIYSQQSIPQETADSGFYVSPTIFTEENTRSELGQVEYFGPIVTVFKAKSFDEALHKANEVDYALTGGVYTRNPNHIEKAKKFMQVGNLYINRQITGAIVDRQPFGGFKLSGVGAKAGGPDYLKQFLEPISITENTMRRGFVPEE